MDHSRGGLWPAAVLLLVVLTVVVYWPVQQFDFVNYDDEGYVSQNRHVRAGLTGEGVVWAFTNRQMGHWHPLAWLSHMLDSQLFSNNPGGHHWTNVLIHLLNILLLLGLLHRMTGRFWRSFLVAALFALHPLNVESVAWISERKNVLSTSFWFITLWTYIYYLASPGIGRYALLFFSFVLGLLVKPMLVTLPFVLLLLDFWPLNRLRLGQTAGIENQATQGMTPWPALSPLRLIIEKIPLFILTLFSSFMTLQAAKSVDTVATIDVVSFSHRLMTAALSYAAYVSKMVWPHDLAVFYPYPQSWSVWQVGGAVFFLSGVSGLALLLARRRPYLPVGWFWYLGTLVPVIGLIQVGGQAMADRYAYVPLIGLFILVVWGTADGWGKAGWRRIAFPSLWTMILLILTVSTVKQLPAWRNSFTLFEKAIAVTERNHVAHSNLGVALMRTGRLEEAAVQYQAALRIKPDPEFHNNLGLVLAEMGRTDEAMSQYQAALKGRPTYGEAYNNIGVEFGRRGKYSEALAYFEKALALKPEYADAHNNLGYALSLMGRPGAAISHYESAIRLDPYNPRFYRNLGIALMAEGKPEAAVLLFQTALRLAPGDRESLERLRAAMPQGRKGRRGFEDEKEK